MFCSNCGKEIDENASFCCFCGKNLKENDEKVKDDTIYCPKCNSSQLTSNAKGFGGGKALVGAVVAGGLGLLAGTIGSENIIITCLNCGHKFKPGGGAVSLTDEDDNKILELLRSNERIQAVMYYKNKKNCDLATANNYIKSFAEKNNITL